MTNASLKQFAYWHQNYAIDEQMIPYFGMHSAKQARHSKSVWFGYKSFVLASSDRYWCHIILYSGVKGVGGTPGKDLTVSVVSNLVLQCKEGIGNFTFDNWYASIKLMSLLTAMDIPTICTGRDDHSGEGQIKSKASMSKLERGELSYAYDYVGELSYAYDYVVGLHFVRWNDNSAVTMLSNCIGPYPLDRVEWFSRNEKRWIPVARPNPIKVYDSAIGGVDLLDSTVGTYCTNIKGKKRWWPHYTNTLGILMGTAWNIYHVINPDADQSSWLSLDLWFSHTFT